MENIREDFPRLYFLSDEDVLDVLVTSNDPRKLLPVVRKCFPGIHSVKFSFPDEGTKPNTALDASLKREYTRLYFRIIFLNFRPPKVMTNYHCSMQNQPC